MALTSYPLFAWKNWVAEAGAVLTASSQAGDLSPAEVATRSPQDFWRSARALDLGVSEWLGAAFAGPREIGLCVLRWDRESLVPVTGDTLRLRLYASEAVDPLLARPSSFDFPEWEKSSSTEIDANVTQAADGSSTADKLIATSAFNNFHYVEQDVELAENQLYTLVVEAKAAGWNWLQMRMQTRGAATHSAYFNLATGENGQDNGSSYGVVAHEPEDLGNGWYRCSITGSSLSGGIQPKVVFYATTADGTPSAPGDDVSGIYLCNADLTFGEEPGSTLVYDTGSVVADVDPIRGLWAHPLSIPITADSARVDLSFAGQFEAELGQWILSDAHQFSRNIAWSDVLTADDDGEIAFGPSGRTDGSRGKAYWLREFVLPRLGEADRRAWEEADYAARRLGQLVFVGDPADANRTTIVGCRPQGAGGLVRRNLPFGEKAQQIREDV